MNTNRVAAMVGRTVIICSGACRVVGTVSSFVGWLVCVLTFLNLK